MHLLFFTENYEVLKKFLCNTLHQNFNFQPLIVALRNC